jgi:hypothetical protein
VKETLHFKIKLSILGSLHSFFLFSFSVLVMGQSNWLIAKIIIMIINKKLELGGTSSN